MPGIQMAFFFFENADEAGEGEAEEQNERQELAETAFLTTKSTVKRRRGERC